MAFPFSITYSIPLEDKIPDVQQALAFVNQTFTKKRADIIETKTSQIIYNGSNSMLKTNIFFMVDKGLVEIIDNEKNTTIIYRIELYTICIFAIISLIIALALAQHIWLTVSVFTSMFGGYVFSIFIRHYLLIKGIARNINHLFKLNNISN
ncbi:MAG: hypothetical protein EOP46_21360 [Sphingobacteriaceae bacterium]|nr:MAG: hypothetical protein EOP46_21360 [Sphingobacteriaceae bacterium]